MTALSNGAMDSPAARMKFGVFMAPFHRPGENPTLALERDLELLQWLDTLGFDAAYIGEHHSGRVGNHRLPGKSLSPPPPSAPATSASAPASSACPIIIP